MSRALTAAEALERLAHVSFVNEAAKQQAEMTLHAEVTRDVNAHEEYVVGQTEEVIGDVQSRVTALATDITAAAELLEARLVRGEIDPVEAYAELRLLEGRAKAVLTSAGTLPARAAGLLDRLADPVASFSRLQWKFPSLRKPYLPN